MTGRIHDNILKGIILVVLFTVLVLQTLVADAQLYQRKDQNLYKGFVASFGTRSITLSSSIQEMHLAKLLQAGCKVGLIYENQQSNAGYFGNQFRSASVKRLVSDKAEFRSKK